MFTFGVKCGDFRLVGNNYTERYVRHTSNFRRGALLKHSKLRITHPPCSHGLHKRYQFINYHLGFSISGPLQKKYLPMWSIIFFTQIKSLKMDFQYEEMDVSTKLIKLILPPKERKFDFHDCNLDLLLT